MVWSETGVKAPSFWVPPPPATVGRSRILAAGALTEVPFRTHEMAVSEYVYTLMKRAV